MGNTDEVYQLWDSTDELMCHPDIAHPVHFDIAFGQDETFEISYEGEILKKKSRKIFFGILRIRFRLCHWIGWTATTQMHC